MHRGRGLRSPHLARDLGPALREVLGLGDDELQPNTVLERLRDAIAVLPQDMQVAFLHGLGARSREPFLGERLAVAADVLHRDVRTARRRLAEANVLVAQALRAPEVAGPTVRPVRNLVHNTVTDLRGERVVLTSTKAVQRRRAGSIILTERFGAPGPRPLDRPDLVVRGAELLDVQPISGSVWEARIELPPDEERTTAAYSLVVTVDDRDSLGPFTVVVPMQVLNSCSVTVHPGRAQITSVREVWGALPVTLYEPAPPGSGGPPSSPTLALSVDRPQLGLAYGFAWTWGP